MFCLATFSIDGIPSIFNSVVAKELNITPSQQKIYPIRTAYVSQYEALRYMRADSETNFREITKKCSKKIFRGNSKEAQT